MTDTALDRELTRAGKRVQMWVGIVVGLIALASAGSVATVRLMGLVTQDQLARGGGVVTQEQVTRLLADHALYLREHAKSDDAVLVERQAQQYQALTQRLDDLRDQMLEQRTLLLRVLKR